MKEKYTHVRIDREDKEIIAKFLKIRKMSFADLFRRLSPVCKDMLTLAEYPNLELRVRV